MGFAQDRREREDGERECRQEDLADGGLKSLEITGDEAVDPMVPARPWANAAVQLPGMVVAKPAAAAVHPDTNVMCSSALRRGRLHEGLDSTI